MFHKDMWGYIIQINGDGGDTAAREGQAALGVWYYDKYFSLRHEELPYERFSSILQGLQEAPGVIVRHPIQYTDEKDIPGDQLMPLVIAAGFYGNKTFVRKAFWNLVKNFGRFPNGDFAGPGNLSAFFRALGWWWLYPVITLFDLSEVANSAIISFWKGREPGPIRKWLGKHVHYIFVQDYKGEPNNPDSWSQHGKENVDNDVRHVQHLIQARLRYPTPLSWLARKLYAKFRPSYTPGVSGPQYAYNVYFDPSTFANPFHVYYGPMIQKMIIE